MKLATLDTEQKNLQTLSVRDTQSSASKVGEEIEHVPLNVAPTCISGATVNPRRHPDFTKIVLNFVFPILLAVRLL